MLSMVNNGKNCGGLYGVWMCKPKGIFIDLLLDYWCVLYELGDNRIKFAPLMPFAEAFEWKFDQNAVKEVNMS